MTARLGPGAALLWTLCALLPARARAQAGPCAFVAPEGFVRQDPGLYEGTVALVPLLEGTAERRVLAVYREERAEGAATLLVARVDRPLELTPTARANAASAVASHFRAELGLEVVVDRATRHGPPGMPRLETRAESFVEGATQVVRMAFVPAGAAHYVLAASMPAGRELELGARVRAAFEQFDVGIEPESRARHVGIRVFASGAAGLAVVALRLWRSGRRSRKPASGGL